jgi:hypothetical protein
MRRIATLSAALAALIFPTAAQAAAPTATTGQATNIQGVSALLTGTLNPGGLPTAYRFAYVDEGSFAASGFGAAIVTATTDAGSGSADRRVSAAISGLRPGTKYRFRLTAANSAGTGTGAVGEFTTTAGFGFLPGEEGFAAEAIAEGGGPATAAGSHPYALRITFGLRPGGDFEGEPGASFSDGDLRDLRIDLPPGMLQNPDVVRQCSAADFRTPRNSPFEESLSGESCPDTSQVGTVEFESAHGTTRRFGVFNLTPSPGIPAALGFAPFGEPIVLNAEQRVGGEIAFALSLRATNFPQWLDFRGMQLTLWGTPWGVSHNGERGNCLNEAEPAYPWAKCSVGSPGSLPPLAYLTLPTTCEGPLAFAVHARSWQQPGLAEARADSSPLGDCDSLTFDPRAFGRLGNSRASSSSGFNFQLTNDNSTLTIPTRRIPTQTRSAVVTLPEGTSINPSVGAGLGVCTPAQYVAETPTSAPGSGCPNESTIGDFTVETPLFQSEQQIDGAIYLAAPYDNPSGALVGIYLIAKLPKRGVLIRLAGRLDPNPRTGRVTARFDNLPQLPYTNLEVNFREGQRAPLVSPPTCGVHPTQIELSPWAGGARIVHQTSESHIDAGIEGGPCPSGTPPFGPGVLAGGVNSNVGSYTPYFVHISRKDTEQEVTSYSLELPNGISGKLAGVPFCPEAGIAAARGRSGVEETNLPSCPSASQVGRTLTGYGVGPALTYAPGRIYLAGPYQGRPLSLVTVNAVTIGPFDLGTVVIRSAFSLNERTAQLAIDSSRSDPIPHILYGIPLRLRDIRVYVDRPEFTLNPTSCEPSQLLSTVTGAGADLESPADDSISTSGVPFQLLNCGTLGYSPKLGLKLRGGTRIGANPSLQAVVQGRPGDANLKSFVVTMPRSQFLAQENIRGVCTRVQFAARACPPNSVYGRAVAFTPLLDEPLRGNVYLRSSSNPLPDLVASLDSGSIHLVIEGRIGSKRGGIQAAFENLPDAPLTRFVMRMNGGRRGLLVNSANVCKNPPTATVRAIGQNNRGASFRTVLRGDKCKKRRRRGAKRHGRGKRGKKPGKASIAMKRRPIR